MDKKDEKKLIKKLRLFYPDGFPQPISEKKYEGPLCQLCEDLMKEDWEKEKK